MENAKFNLFLISLFISYSCISFSQENPLHRLDFIIGEWSGTGTGYGNSKSTIKASFNFIMGGKYIESFHDSKSIPTSSKPEGENHLDKGIISFDESRNMIVYRQFNNEGYVNQYVLIDSLSNNNKLVFETEEIENFVPGGAARWTVIKSNAVEIETIFDVSFPEKGYSCFGTNKLTRQE